MKKTAQLKSLVMAMAVAGSTVAALTPATSQADVSYNASVSNMYLWRGQNLGGSNNGVPQVAGGADYSSDMFYAGTWVGSGDTTAGTEWDVYAGVTPKFGEVSFNLGIAEYMYPSAGSDIAKTDLSEYVVGIGYKDFSLTSYINTDVTDSMYFSGDYSMGKIGFHVGVTDQKGTANDYMDYNVSYAATDKLSFVLSMASGKAVDGTSGTSPMLQVSYSLM